MASCCAASWRSFDFGVFEQGAAPFMPPAAPVVLAAWDFLMGSTTCGLPPRIGTYSRACTHCIQIQASPAISEHEV